ncbi:uncharacterized protein LOC124293393 isoform X2 [Neodiprion lecontei]|nr:uncharacterized protein LOC124293393 isoform X2 [Neodiprion lecontei]
MIDSREDITKLQKFLYLKNCLEGDALNKILIYNVSEENYGTAWKLLLDSYDKTRILIVKHLDAILELPAVKKATHKDLARLVDDMRQHVNMLASLDVIPDEHLLVRIIERALPNNIRVKWEETLNLDTSPTLEQIYKFVSETAFRLYTLEQDVSRSKTETNYKRPLPNYKDQSGIKTRRGENGARTLAIGTSAKCVVCKRESHPIYQCREFQKMTVHQRWNFVKSSSLCKNCLRSHRGKCTSTHCKNCSRFHHTLLHNESPAASTHATQETIPSDTPKSTTKVNLTCSKMITYSFTSRALQSQLMLSAQIRVKDSRGQYLKRRALLDTCATAHFITEDLVRELKLPIRACTIAVGMIDDANTISKGAVECTFYSIHDNFNKTLTFLVIPKIADNVPNEIFPRESIDLPRNVKLADPQFHLPGRIDILIGSGTTLSLLSIGQCDLSRDGCDLVLQKTQLGWAVAGGKSNTTVGKRTSCQLTELKETIEKFWLLDDANAGQRKLSENTSCETHFIRNVTREPSGRYVVRLPFRSADRDLGDSRSMALRRFAGLQKRLNADPVLKAEYHRVMNEYIELGHMSLVVDESLPGYYLPHHAVIKATSATTKTRVVFDASAKTSMGVSLNDTLMVGPTIQLKLIEHLLRFRSYKFVITADIAKMYRQIWIAPSDRRYQRVFWLQQERIRVFELNTVTFGVSSAPFLAIRTVQKLASDESADYPKGAEVLTRDLYVDDLLSGANTFEEIVQIRDEVIEILKRGGFDIRQWASNHPQALNNLSKKTADIDFLTDENPVHKTLGISWNARNDDFLYTVKRIEPSEKVTKRYILSEIAKIFDPLGLLGPVILTSKVIMQRCWKAKTTWDESVPSALDSAWRSFAEQLSLINNLKIDRYVSTNNPIDIQIHGFCDASQTGYGACIYVRSCEQDGEIRVRLFCSKGRVAPLKDQTIPRLELCGALTLARLYREVLEVTSFRVDKTIFWSDSTIVLQWLNKHPSVLKVFEAHRVAEIQEVSKDAEWRHIRTDQNPADALSRGQFPREFLNNDSWLRGPAWLTQPESVWPQVAVTPQKDLPGIKKSLCMFSQSQSEEIFKNFSSYTRLIRVVAYCLRFSPNNNVKGALTIKEIEEAEYRVIRLIQQAHFQDEIDRLLSEERVKCAKLGSLNPRVDERGLIRVGGRINKADISLDQRNPILLPSRHHVTDLLIRHTHEKFFHTGIQSTLYSIRQRFWILDGRNQIRKVVRRCVRCIRFRAKPETYKMADLPKSRVDNAPPFYHTGVDYFGPILAKEKKHRNRSSIKVYGCVFICMSTKAIHIEIASDLSTDAFIAALRRFVSRRGIPGHIYSDNGTNFVGANSQLREFYAVRESEDFRSQLYEFTSTRKIEWHFNPPLSPHFGGIWEAAVKSCKHHLKRVMCDFLFTYEELTTLAIEIEGILNSRPLCPISTDPNDPIALTPAHFLVGRPLTMLPENDLSLVPDNRISSWQLITKTRQEFWRRWQLEYLSELQKRQKWINPTKNIALDTVVLLIDKNQPCMQWRLGRVVELHPGDDGVVRVVTVKTTRGLYKRNTRSICALPISA